MTVERLFLAVPWGCLRFVIVVFPDHTHLLFFRHMLDPGLSTKRTRYSDVRRIDVSYSILRLGANDLNENNLFHSQADPTYLHCINELESTQHFLLECPQHEFARIELRIDISHITKRYFSINLLPNPPEGDRLWQ